jgi:hypothetical protein
MIGVQCNAFSTYTGFEIGRSKLAHLLALNSMSYFLIMIRIMLLCNVKHFGVRGKSTVCV